MSDKKKPGTKTIEVSTDFYDVLCRYKKKIREIVHKPISHEKVIKLAFCFKNIDTQLSEMMAERF